MGWNLAGNACAGSRFFPGCAMHCCECWHAGTAQMQWLLRLIRGAAGDAHAALAAVPESVVRDAAGWLTFVIRWGHADLLGGCNIGGLVQVGTLSVRICVKEAVISTSKNKLYIKLIIVLQSC